MSLWRVTITRTLIVQADDEMEAMLTGQEYEREAASDSEPDEVFVDDVTLDSVPKEWLQCMPYGGDDDLTVEQILTSQPPEPVRDDKTIDMFRP